jgi:hypothetical protein
MLLELADGKGEIPKDMLLDFVYSERPLGDFEEELKEYDRKNNQC